MRVIFIRHAEPDYSMLDNTPHPSDYRGFGRDLAPLFERGRKLARELAKSPLLQEAEVLISSSITRALETVSYLVRHQEIPLFVEPFLHEWRPDMEGNNYQMEELRLAHESFIKHKGALSSDCPIRYETAAEMKERLLITLANYQQYNVVAIVCHGMLMRQFVE